MPFSTVPLDCSFPPMQNSSLVLTHFSILDGPLNMGQGTEYQVWRGESSGTRWATSVIHYTWSRSYGECWYCSALLSLKCLLHWCSLRQFHLPALETMMTVIYSVLDEVPLLPLCYLWRKKLNWVAKDTGELRRIMATNSSPSDETIFLFKAMYWWCCLKNTHARSNECTLRKTEKCPQSYIHMIH